MKTLLFISLLISLTLAACGGGVGRNNGRDNTLASADTIAMLREVEILPDSLIPVDTLYHHDGIEF